MTEQGEIFWAADRALTLFAVDLDERMESVIEV